MICYQDGSQVIPGDTVLMYQDRVPGVVEAVLCSEESLKEWGVEDAGVVFASERFGRVFESEKSFSEEPFLLVARGKMP